MDPLTSIPVGIAAGDSLDLLLSFTYYSANDGWAAAWHLNGPEARSLSFTASDASFALTLTGTDTATWVPGYYRWLIRVSSGGSVVTVASGGITVGVNLATASADALATWEETTLSVVESALTGNLTAGMKMYMIGGRQVQTLSIDELIRLRNQLRTEIQRQRQGGFGTPIIMNAVGQL